jgi:hypothetical protein
MKHINFLVALMSGLLLFAWSSSSIAQDTTRTRNKAQVKKQLKDGPAYQNKIQHGSRFQDKNGDGYNDNAPDHDGDGIPNGQDPDYDGAKQRLGNGKGGFVDVNGDGINDNANDWDNDGIPNGKDPDFVRPQDGSGQQYKYGNRSRNQFGKNSQNRHGRGTGVGPGDGTGNRGVGPKNGGNGDGNGDGNGEGGNSGKGKGRP